MQTSPENTTPLAKEVTQNEYQQYFKTGHCLMLTALCLALVCICISFVFDAYFSFPVQIAAHIGTLIFAGLLKIGYIIRCAGAHGLGHKAF